MDTVCPPSCHGLLATAFSWQLNYEAARQQWIRHTGKTALGRRQCVQARTALRTTAKLERLSVLRANLTISATEHGQLQLMHAACGLHTWHVRAPLLVKAFQLLASCGIM